MVTARSIVAALALMPASALAQNSYSFTNAGESMVRYSVASTHAAMSSGRPVRRAVAIQGAFPHELAQPAGLGVPLRHLERRQLGSDQRQAERTLLTEICRSGDDLVTEDTGHLLPRP